MPDRATISRVAKILARATGPEPGEAQTALEHAYKRMARDGVTLADLLTLPEEELFQEALVGLVQVILANQPDLSPATRREVYAQYLRMIADKFNGAGQGGADPSQEREDAARDYRQRNGYEESQGQAEKQENDKSFTQKNRKTNNQENDLTGFQFRVPKSMAQVVAIVRPWFDRGGVLWLAIHDPVLVLRMLAASMLWGMGFAVVVITSAAIVHAFTDSSPWIDVRLKNLFAFLTALGTLWRMRLFLTKN